MKALKRGWRGFAYKILPKAFNVIVIFGLIFQPVGPAGISSTARAIESDATDVVTADEPASVAPEEEAEPEPEAKPEEKPAPVVEEKEAVPVVSEESLEEAPAVPVVVAPVDEPETLPATEEVPAVEETVPGVVPADPVETPAAEIVPSEVDTPEVEQNGSKPDTNTEDLSGQVCLSDSADIKTSSADDWSVDEKAGKTETKEKVSLGVTYEFPLDRDVRVTFTCLPKNESLRASLSIERILASDIDLPAGVSVVGGYAYDIATKGMDNGDFKYDLVLPKSAGIDDADVVYVEKSADEVRGADLSESDLKEVDKDDVKNKADSLEAADLDHFTTFFVATYSDVSFDVEKGSYYQGETVYAKASGFNANKFYRIAVNPPGDNNSSYITGCFNPSSSDDILTGTYSLPSNAATGNNNWKVELMEFDYDDCHDIDIQKRSEDKFSVLTPPYTPTRICHATGSESNPFNVITPNTAGILMGHVGNGHQNGEDIIPPVPYYLPAGQNWVSGQAIWNNDCQATGGLRAVKVVDDQSDLTQWSFQLDHTGPIVQANANGVADFGQVVLGQHTITEIGLSSYSITSISGLGCTAVPNAPSALATVASGSTTECTFSNAIRRGSITIEKDAQPDDAQDFSFSGSLGIFSLDDAADLTLSNSKTANNLLPGNYSVTENSVPGWRIQGISCTGNNRSFRTDDSTTQVIALAPGENVRCVYTNIKEAYCGDGIVNQEREQCDGTAGIPSASFVCNESCQLELVEPKIGICHATDSQNNPYNFEQPNKSADVSGHDGHDGDVWFFGIANHAWGDIIPPFDYIGGSYPGQNWTPEGQAIWNNQCAVLIGSVKVNKYTDANGDGDYRDSGESLNGSASNSFRWTLDGTGSSVFGSTVNGVPKGSHMVSETGTSGYHFVGWFPTGSTQYSCAHPKGTVLPIGVEVASGQVIDITLCNARDTGKITIIKDAINNDAQDFSFTTTGGLGSFVLDDDGNNSTNNGGRSNTKVFMAVGTGTYTVTEASASNWQLTKLVCTSNQEEGAVNLETATRTATIDLAAGEEVVCTFTNTKLGKIEGVKFDDKDGDGRRDEHENRLNGWKIFIDQNENSRYDDGEPSDTTSGNFWFFNLGAYAFEHLLPETYTVCEEMQDGWYASLPVCRTVELAPGETETVDFANHQAARIVASKIMCADESELPNWGAHGGPNVTATTAQWWVNTHPSCKLVSDWNFQWSYDGVPNPGDNNTGDPLEDWTKFGPTTASGVAETMIPDLKGNQKVWVREMPKAGYLPFTGYPNVNPVSAEMYCHTDAINYDNWEWIDDPQYGETYHCVAWNVELGSISGQKWNDLNGNGERDCIASEEESEGDEKQACEYEPLLSGWTIYLDLNNDGDRDENEPSDVTGEDGSFEFTGLVPRHYVVREVMKSGWQQTANSCGVVEEEENPEENNNENARFFRPEPKPQDGTEVKPGSEVRCMIGNMELPSLSIEKWNDSVGVEQPGNTVRYHIKVTAHGNDVLGVQVVDLPPAGFVYVSGSAVADQGSLAHTYASPGIWDLGDMAAGQSVELAYDTMISSTQDSGDYKDLAYARGTSEAEAPVLADDLLDADNFVGTNVEVALAETPATIVIPEDNEHKIKEKTVRKTQVLGASTVLPMTGAHTGFLVLALALLLGGIALIVLGRRRNRESLITQTMTKVLFFAAIAGVSLLSGQVVQAAESTLSVQIETPVSVVDSPAFKIGFVVLDIANGTPAVTCQVDNGSGFVAFPAAHIEYVAQPGGNSGNCVVDAAVMPADGDYVFRVVADAVPSGAVPVKLASTVPGTPYDYDRNDASCMNHITFTTASDAGRTVKVELYRSLATTFSADAGTKVAEQAIGSGVSGSFSVAAPGCSNDSFYALRAVDAYGHGSAFVGDADRNVDTDTVTHTKTKTVEGSETNQVGAIPVAGAAGAGEVQGAETVNGSEAGEEGSVLGDSDEAAEGRDGEGSWMSTHPWRTGFILLILLAIGYGLYTKRKDEEQQ